MNGTAAWSRLKQRLFDGRIEKRLPVSISIYLTSLRKPRSFEQTTTENVSPHGARTISKRSWRSGEQALIGPLTGVATQVGRVVYCGQKTEGRFCLGLEFLARSVNWVNHTLPYRVANRIGCRA